LSSSELARDAFVGRTFPTGACAGLVFALVAKTGDRVVGVGAAHDRGLLAPDPDVLTGDALGDRADRDGVGVARGDVAVVRRRVRVVDLVRPVPDRSAAAGATEQEVTSGADAISVVLAERLVHRHRLGVPVPAPGVPVDADHAADDELAHDDVLPGGTAAGDRRAGVVDIGRRNTRSALW